MKIILLIGIIGLIGCTEFKAGNMAGLTSTNGCEEDCESLEKAVPTVGVVKQSQLFPAYKKCLNLPKENISALTRQTNLDIRPNLSAEGNLESFSAPTMMAVTQLAGAVCQDLIDYEITLPEKNYFTSFNLDGASESAEDLLKNDISKIAGSCWGRRPASSEVDLVVEKFKGNASGGVLDSSGALFLCTVLLSTADIILY